jgi:hypothetical protein
MRDSVPRSHLLHELAACTRYARMDRDQERLARLGGNTAEAKEWNETAARWEQRAARAAHELRCKEHGLGHSHG